MAVPAPFAYWKLNEAAGISADDSTTHGLALGATAGVGSTAGKIGTARSFPGSISVEYLAGNSVHYQTGNEVAFTFVGWFKPAIGTGGSPLIAVIKGNSDWQIYYELYDGFTRYTLTLVTDSGVDFYPSPLNAVAGNWHFVAVRYDPTTNELTLRVNNTTTTVSRLTGPRQTALYNLNLGGKSGFGNTWEGGIDECAYWKLALTNSQLDEMFNANAGLTYEDIVTSATLTIANPFTVEIDNLGMSYGLIEDVNISLQEVETELLSPIIALDATVTTTLQFVDHDSFLVSFTNTIEIALQQVGPNADTEAVELFSHAIINDLFLNLSLQTVSVADFPLEIISDVQLDLTLQVTAYPEATGIFSLLPAIFTPHPPGPGYAHFTEPSRSSSSVVVYGTEPGPFKLNPAASVYRRNGRSHVVHLAQVKPLYVENYGLFDLLGAAVELSIEEFDYRAPGGYLRIWNDVVLLSNLQPDPDWATATAAIVIDPNTAQDVYGVTAQTTFLPPREIL